MLRSVDKVLKIPYCSHVSILKQKIMIKKVCLMMLLNSKVEDRRFDNNHVILFCLWASQFIFEDVFSEFGKWKPANSNF